VFFSSRRRHTRSKRDWSSDVCSSDLDLAPAALAGVPISARGFTWQHAERDRPAIAGLEVQIPAGQKVLLLGPSGAGKSTLLHARSEERRVGKDGRSRRWPSQQ